TLAAQLVIDLRRDLRIQLGQYRVQGRGHYLLEHCVLGACGRGAHSSPPFLEAYSSAESSGPSDSAATLKSQPASYGALLIRAGSSTTAEFTSVTSPVTGEYRSETDFVDSTSPHVPLAVTAEPTSG